MATATEPLVQAQERTVSLLDKIAEENARAQAETARLYTPALSVDQFMEREALLDKLVSRMVEGVDYVTLPGNPKPFLSKAGAEKACVLFGYVPRYEVIREIEDWSGVDHDGEPLFYYRYRCNLSKEGRSVGEGEGSCNTRESKYRFRIAKPECPACGVAAIITGKAEWGGGFVCHKKQGGCGSKFEDGDERILNQPKGRVINPDIADCINTVQKMGQKRAHVAATLSATGLSSRFSQDLDEYSEPQAETPKRSAQPEPPSAEPVDPRPVPEDLKRHLEHFRDHYLTRDDPRPVPEELKLHFERIADKGAVGKTTDLLFDLMKDLEGGAAAHTELTEALRKKYPRGKTIPYDAIKAMWLDMWDEIQKRKPAEAPENEAL